jgi:hypothetical protein
MNLLYKDTDYDLFGQNIDNILEEVKLKNFQVREPKEKEIREIMAIIVKYVKDNKRKIYGGYSMNMLLMDKDPKLAIYKESDIPDIDFYSPEPIVDLMKLCNILHEKGYKNVVGHEAQHKETYTIHVNTFGPYCDISYVPRNIYNKLPFKEIKGIYNIHPSFMTIDYLRMLSDPLDSFWRIDKGFKRFIKLTKTYPLPKIDKPLNVSLDKSIDIKIMSDIENFIGDKESMIAIGFYTYNKFLEESGIMASNSKKYKLLNIPYYELISTNFKEDTNNMIDYLKSLYPEMNTKLKVVEHYPFFQFLGHGAYIYIGDVLIAIVYDYNNKCIPYIKIKSKTNKNISIGTYTVTLMYALMTVMKVRTDGDDETKDLYHTLISHMIEMRNYYFDKTKKNIFAKSLFQDFLVECKGDTLSIKQESQQKIEMKKKQNKPYKFRYEPANGVKEPESNYVFANSSGNPINNPRNLKLSNSNETSEEDTEEDTEEIKKVD